MSRQRYLAESIRDSREGLLRYLKGFNDTNHTKQAPGLPNHVAWTLGHLSLLLHRNAQKLDGVPVPESDFVKGDGRAGNAQRYDTESVFFASTPVDDPSIYPTFARCLEIFDSAIERCAMTLHNATEAQLDSTIKWGAADIPAWKLAPRIIFHNGTHTGQIVDLRRALRLGSIFA